jgi:hypothetical protein
MSADSTAARTVVICGSMKNMDLMTEIGKLIESTGLNVVTPVPDAPAEPWSVQSSTAVKREASRRHMNYIRQSRTVAVLVVNVDRPGANNYVGPNSFAEIGVAFSDNRRIFLLQGMPECYADELIAWGVECLNGDLRRLVRDLGVQHDMDWSQWRDVYKTSAV